MIHVDLQKLLTPLQQTLARPDKLLRAVSASMAEETLNLIKDGYRTETDPYGTPWAPKQAQDGRKTLSGPTGRLKTGWHKRRVDESGFLIAPSVTYAVHHQTGTRKMPQRMQVPDAAKGLPDKWQRLLEETALEGIAAVFDEAARKGGMK